MTTYELPTPPDGPVWDKDGNEWQRAYDGGEIWTSSNYFVTWAELLQDYGSLTTTPPPKVGYTVTTTAEYEALPQGSIVVADNSLLAWNTSGFDHWKSGAGAAGSAEMSGEPRRVLRVGWTA